MAKFLTSALIVIFFLTMMTLLAINQVIPRYQYGNALPVQAEQITDDWEDIDEAMAVSLNGMPVGLIRQQVVKDPNGEGYAGKTVFLLRAGFVSADMKIRSNLDQKLRMVDLYLSVNQMKEESVMEVFGKISQENVLVMQLKAPTGVRYREFPLKTDPTLNVNIANMLTTLQENPDSEYVLNVYEPIMGLGSDRATIRLGEAEMIKIGDKEVFASVVESGMDTFKSKLYFDERNRLVRRTLEFESKQAEGSKQSIPNFAIVMDRVEEHELMEESNQFLAALDEVKTITWDDVRGEDSGEVPGLLNLPSLLIRNSFQSQ